MATFKADIQDKRADGTYAVRIRVIHNRTVRRIPTNIYVTDEDLTVSKRIRNQTVLDTIEDILRECRAFCTGLNFELNQMSPDVLAERLKWHLEGGDRFKLDLFGYTRKRVKGMHPGTAGGYLNMLNALRRYTSREELDIAEITSTFLRGFEKFLGEEPSQRGANRKHGDSPRVNKGGRAVSQYLGLIRAMHNRAKLDYNDEEGGIVRIPQTPFRYYRIPPQPATRKRALSVDVAQALDEANGTSGSFLVEVPPTVEGDGKVGIVPLDGQLHKLAHHHLALADIGGILLGGM